MESAKPFIRLCAAFLTLAGASFSAAADKPAPPDPAKTPAKAQAAPAKAQVAPAKAQPAPAKKEAAPAKKQSAPAKAQPAPAKKQTPPPAKAPAPPVKVRIESKPAPPPPAPVPPPPAKVRIEVRPTPPPPAPPRDLRNDPPLPDAAMLQKLARRALMNVTGVRMRVGPVILRERLPDGSWLVDVTLENGRMIRGRLYRNRRRYRIAVEARDLYSQEQTIQIVK